MSLIKKLAGETVIYGLSSIVGRFMYFLLTPYLTRIFEKDEYGIIGILFTYSAILMIFYAYRFETAFFRFGSRDGNLDKAFSTSSISLLGTTAIFTTFIFLLLEPISNFIQHPEHLEYIGIVAIIIAFDALAAIPFARLRLENRPIRFAIIKTLGIVVNIISVILFLEIIPNLIENGNVWLTDFYNEENKIIYVFVANLLASGVVLLLLSPLYLKIKWVFDKALWKKMFWYAAPLIVVGFAAVINQLIALPLLERLLPGTLEENRAQSGIYSAAAKLAILMNLFTQAFNYAAEPFFFKNANRSDAKKIYAQVGHAFALVGCFAFLIIMLYLDVIQYFLGKEFREGLEIVPILLMAYLCLGLYYNFSIWYKLTDKTKIGAYISLGGVAITLLINFLLVPNPNFGYFGAAWAALGCYGFMAIAGYLTGQKYYPIAYPMKRIIGWMGMAVLLFLGSDYLNGILENGLILKMILNTFILILFGGVVYFFEKENLKAMT